MALIRGGRVSEDMLGVGVFSFFSPLHIKAFVFDATDKNSYRGNPHYLMFASAGASAA